MIIDLNKGQSKTIATTKRLTLIKAAIPAFSGKGNLLLQAGFSSLMLKLARLVSPA